MKGIEPVISTIAIITLVLAVLSGTTALWSSGWGGGAKGVTLDSAKTNACAVVMRYYEGCAAKHTFDVPINNFDANNDGTIADGTEASYPATCSGGNDNLARLCRCYYNAATDSECRKVCGCGEGPSGGGPGPGPSDCPDGTCDVGENCPADADSCTEPAICYSRTCVDGCNNPADAMPNGQQDTEGLNRCDNTEGCDTPPCQCDGIGNCINAPVSDCPDGVCEDGENCPADADSCTEPVVCYSRTCVDGCNNPADAMPNGQQDTEGLNRCDNTEGCAITPCHCDGSGNCINGPAVLPTADARVGKAPNPTDKGVQVLSGATVYFDGSTYSTGNIVKWEWDFNDTDDGVYDWSSNVDGITNYVYDIGNEYGTMLTVKLRVTDDIGNTDTDTVIVMIGGMIPWADARVGNAPNPIDKYVEVSPSDIVYFDGSTYSALISYYGPGSGIVKYEWDFNNTGNGVYDWSSDTSGVTTHTYYIKGMYLASLRITDINGNNDTDAVIIEVGSKPPIADARVGDHPNPTEKIITVNVSDTVYFDGSTYSKPGSPDTPIVKWEWDFNDTDDDVYDWSSNVDGITNYVYYIEGKYVAKLRVTDSVGNNDTDIVNITVKPLEIGCENFALTADIELVLDTSLSMGTIITSSEGWWFSEMQIEYGAVSGLINLVALSDNWTWGVVEFRNESHKDIGLTPLNNEANKYAIKSVLPTSEYDGENTNMLSGIRLGLSELLNSPRFEKTIDGEAVKSYLVLITDGGVNQGCMDNSNCDGEVIALVNNEVKSRGIIVVVGDIASRGYDESLLQDLPSDSSKYIKVYQPEPLLVFLGSMFGVQCNIIPIADARAGKAPNPIDKYITVKEGKTVYFDGSTYSKPSTTGTIVKWEWDFTDDGTYEFSSDVDGITMHVYNTEDTYEARLRVTDSNGVNNNNIVTIKVIQDLPLAASIISPTDGDTFFYKEPIIFKGSAIEGTPPYTYVWTSSIDGNLGNWRTSSKDDLTKGNHVITLTVTDSDDTTATKKITIHIKDLDLPTSFDWSHQVLPAAEPATGDWMTPIKNQQSCGSCWAFGSIGPVEAKWNWQNSNPNLDIDLSEQYLVSCPWPSIGSCSGGDLAFPYIQSDGVVDETCYPYLDFDATCPATCVDGSAFSTRSWKISGFASIRPNMPYIKQHLVNNGPLFAAMSMADWILSGSTGICTYGGELDHAIAIVGYDDAEGVWIVRNSWGLTWPGSINGYFKVKYGNCGIEEDAYYIGSVIQP